MIYASLPTIRAWHQPLVAPIYLVLGLATGGVLLELLAAAFGDRRALGRDRRRWSLMLGAVLQVALLARSTPRRREPRPRPRPGSASSARCGRSIRRTPSRIS